MYRVTALKLNTYIEINVCEASAGRKHTNRHKKYFFSYMLFLQLLFEDVILLL
jgi:hypothetical protein